MHHRYTEPFVMSLAGLDPSGGAGLLADIKTFEALQTTGLGICTAITRQTDSEFLGVEWISAGRIIAQAAPLLQKYPVQFCKVGLTEHPAMLLKVLPALQAIRPGLRFVLDPVLKASAGYAFSAALPQHWEPLLPHIYLLTPNYEEAVAISGAPDGEQGAQKLSAHCAVLLKGGHRPGKQGLDTLYNGNGQTDFQPLAADANPKHGSGCVLSAAITASLAKGMSLPEACQAGKDYTFRYLQSSPALLGRHQF